MRKPMCRRNTKSKTCNLPTRTGPAWCCYGPLCVVNVRKTYLLRYSHSDFVKYPIYAHRCLAHTVRTHVRSVLHLSKLCMHKVLVSLKSANNYLRVTWLDLFIHTLASCVYLSSPISAFSFTSCQIRLFYFKLYVQFCILV